jgi:hypothetical protein
MCVRMCVRVCVAMIVGVIHVSDLPQCSPAQSKTISWREAQRYSDEFLSFPLPPLAVGRVGEISRLVK